MTRLVLAEDHVVMRQALRHLLEAQSDFAVVGETDSGINLGPLVADARADILLLDLGLRGLHGLEAITDVQTHAPACRILVLSMHGSEEYARTALARGASGYVLKGADASELLAALRAVRVGERYVAPQLTHSLAPMVPDAEVDTLPYACLSARERVVLRLVAEGHGNIAIASHLGISPRTVETHRANMMRKVGAGSRADLVRLALRWGIIGASR